MRVISQWIRFIKLVCDSGKSEYNFSLKEKLIGAKLTCNGFSHSYPEEVLDKSEDWCKLKIGDLQFFVPNNVFKPGELSYIYNEVFLPLSENPHAYENEGIKISKGDIVIDAGACEGFFAKYAIERGAEKVYLFEPLAVLQEGLRKTFHHEIINGRIELIPKALSHVTGICNFSQGNEYICEAKIDSQSSSIVDCVTLDEFVEKAKIEKLGFLKMDIEGSEVEAIQGAIKTITKFTPSLSIAVYHSYKNAMYIESLLRNISKYQVFFGGCYMYEKPYRPYMLYAHAI